jgi:hypothetical protein
MSDSSNRVEGFFYSVSSGLLQIAALLFILLGWKAMTFIGPILIAWFFGLVFCNALAKRSTQDERH